jgi:hypothetical protein
LQGARGGETAERILSSEIEKTSARDVIHTPCSKMDYTRLTAGRNGLLLGKEAYTTNPTPEPRRDPPASPFHPSSPST